MTDLANIAASNSLADLAARINVEHEAASTFMQQGLERAIRAGELLIEAKDQVPHGQWLPWLKDNCPAISTRTVQAYMRVSRAFGKLDDKCATRVAYLSFRDALNSLAVAGTIAKDLAPASVELALERFEHDQAQTWERSVRHARMEETHARNRGLLETPQSMLPSPEGRKIRVARNPAERKWILAIGPSITRAALIEREESARASPVVQDLQQDHEELLDRAAALEAEAKALREDAKSVQSQISAEIKKALGPVQSFTETYTFQCDERTDTELAALPQPSNCERQLIDLLLSTRGKTGDGLTEISRGYWGDMRFMSLHPMPPGPGDWTKVGSPDWLHELFPDWNREDDERADEAPHA